jgi:TolA-binding protein
VYEELKKYKEASKEYEKVIEKYPNSEAAIRALRNIERLKSIRRI